MSDFTPPSDPNDPQGGSDPNPDWGQSPPEGTPPQSSPWGEPPQPADWGDPNAAPGYGAGQPPPGQPYGQYGEGAAAQGGYYGAAGAVPYKSSQATTALVLSIAGLLCCGPLSVVGAIMGRSEMKSIDLGEMNASTRGTAQAAFIVGLIGSIIWALFLGLYILGLAVSAGTGI